ncbi:MAG: anaerobic ribonucleoside-triphosphate reductase activating protein [Clostridia bacterium]|nr:anaerobic ribonucleoside-triphosphate reductase activating protein [Clostridia bacterium]
MNIAGLQKSSTIDFPGNLACVLFTPGCNLDCFYCHNRALLTNSAPLMPMEDVMGFLQKRAGLLDGVVVSGGEPTLQNDLTPFLRDVRALGYAIKLDTNGQRPEVAEALLQDGLIDYLAVDVKALPEDYPIVTGTDGYESAIRTLQCAMTLGIPCEGRTTMYPGLRPEKLIALAKAMPQLPRWRLNVYRMPAEYREEDALKLRLPAIAETEARRLLPELRACQPGVVL